MKYYKVELHVHTRYSKDSILNWLFILLMCKIKRIKYLGITDHNELDGALKYAKKLKRFGIIVIPGEEIMTNDGEIIGLYLNKKIPSGLSVEETINEIKKQNGIVYLPHPYDEKRYKTVLGLDKQERYKDKIDFIEVHNGRNVKKEYGKKQEELQKKLAISPIVGSDSHTFFELGRNYILINQELSRDNFCRLIKGGQLKKHKCIKFAHQWTKVARVITLVEKGDFNELCRIIVGKCKR